MSDEEQQDTPEPESLMDQASLWFGRMCGPEAEMHRPQFEAWLARGALHRSFYNRASEIYAIGKFLKEEEAHDEEGDDHADPAPAHQTTSGLSKAWVFGCGFALVCFVIFAFMTLVQRPFGKVDAEREFASDEVSQGIVGSLRTSAGQILTQILSDGSCVTLEANSVLTIAYSADMRSLILKRGSARFEVAHERRPFVVHAGRGSVTARGTIFDVALSTTDAVTVKLVRGSIDVAVEQSDSYDTSVRRLKVGEQVTYTVNGSGLTAVEQFSATPFPVNTPAAAPTALGTPTSDLKDFNGTPLRELVTQVNGQAHGTITLATPALGSLKVSGRFSLDDPDRLARKLALLFDLQADKSSKGEIVLRRQ
ncbi:transmembrane sensor [Sphingobium sp. B2D3A]|uniref:FecR family protein n=1 Tax=unclassified Sphingobium TaxID=2611147 RepID=UPI002225A1E7|nr:MULTISPECIES: FecR domain-containing protein [unclassified Sphingobium]MCW2338180.1 transmembrane sensor [Sphingobium sp. B2D3A]MCW2384639.1 transmembrane sensor [Sphingobium sp. B2D3D]